MKLRRILELVAVFIVLAIVVPFFRTNEVPESEGKEADTSVSASAATPPPGRLSVDGVWLGMTKQQLLTNLGEPSRATPSHADYEQWDYFSSNRLTLMLDDADKVVTVDGVSLTRDGEAVLSSGMPLTAVEQVLGTCRESLDTIPDSVNAGFSTGGQLIHLEHRQKKVSGRVTMTVDYSVVRPPQRNPVTEPSPQPDGIILHEPGPLRQPQR